MKLKPTPIYTDNQELVRIEFYDIETGLFEIEAVWDARDDQTKDNQEAFTKWAYNHIRDRGDEVAL